MGPDLWLTLAILGGAVYLFVTEKLPVDVVAMLVLASLLVLGLVTPGEALSGFSSQATITVAAMSCSAPACSAAAHYRAWAKRWGGSAGVGCSRW